MTPYESFSFSKNGSSILKQLVLITFFMQNSVSLYTEIYIIYIYKYIFSLALCLNSKKNLISFLFFEKQLL